MLNSRLELITRVVLINFIATLNRVSRILRLNGIQLERNANAGIAGRTFEFRIVRIIHEIVAAENSCFIRAECGVAVWIDITLLLDVEAVIRRQALVARVNEREADGIIILSPFPFRCRIDPLVSSFFKPRYGHQARISLRTTGYADQCIIGRINFRQAREVRRRRLELIICTSRK